MIVTPGGHDLAVWAPVRDAATRLTVPELLARLGVPTGAPLLVVGKPLAVWVWALPVRCRRATGAFFHHPAWRIPWLRLTSPLAAWMVHGLTLWSWHLPALFDLALRSDLAHAAQHACFLAGGVVLWSALLGPLPKPAWFGAPARLGYVTAWWMLTGPLGAALAFAGIFGVLSALGNDDHRWISSLISFLYFGTGAVVVLRYGLLAYVVGVFVTQILLEVPATLDPSAWYFGNMALLIAIPVALASWGLYTSVAGRLWRSDTRSAGL